MIESFDLGDIVEMKKQHPCGSNDFEVIRVRCRYKNKMYWMWKNNNDSKK